MNNTLIDNSENLKLVDYLNNLIEDEEINSISIATGYWDLKGIALLTKSLERFLERKNTKLRILIGKDPNVAKNELTKEAYASAKVYPKDYIKIDLQNIELTNLSYQAACNLLIKYCDTIEKENNGSKIQIRIFDTNENDEKQFFHSKCYIFDGKQNSKGYGIVGSSNFTEKGLQGNSELNYLHSDVLSVLSTEKMGNKKSHLFWFTEKWDLAKDWTKEFLIELKSSPIGKKAKEIIENKNQQDYTILSIEETYKKFLIDQFDEIITGNSNITPNDYMPHDANFMKLEYQEHAVNQAFPIMKRHNGVIIADVVGLGKTFTAIMIIKRHLLETGFKNPILIITPPAIKQSWIDSIEYFDKDEVQEKQIKPYITLTTIGTLDSELDEDSHSELVSESIGIDDIDFSFTQNNFSMIVVDESHRFKSNTTKMYKKLDNLIGDIAPEPYVVLLSATPQNNAPFDLRNQIYLFQREYKNSTLSLGEYGNNLESYFSQKQENYKQYIKKDKKDADGNKTPLSQKELQENRKKLIADSEDIRKKIVEPLVIRRTRKDIEKSYTNDKENKHLVFPKIQPPVEIGYEMKGELAELFAETISIIAPQVSSYDVDKKVAGKNALGYYRYRATEYLKSKEAKKLHETRNITVEGTSKRLAELMEISLVKRLESSQKAFKESLHNLQLYTQNMIKMWDLNRIFICPDINVNQELSDSAIKKNGSFENCLDKIKEKANKANKKNSTNENEGANQEYKKTDFIEDYIKLLQNDLRIINELCDSWDKHSNDPKMNIFLKKFESEFFNKKKNPTQKLVIFTECIATQKALEEKLEEDPSYKVLSITADNRKEKQEVIAANFDANYKGEQKNDYQILLTTDVLAEGVNLHRANSILNYDSPWNATRLMQRLGRINRIGSKAKEIWNYNFYPSAQGDEQINLKNRTFVKLQAFHELFGEDSQIFSKEENAKHHELVMHDVEDNSLSPITPFIAELKDLKENHFDEYTRLKNITECAVTFTNSNIYFASVRERYVCERHVHEQKQNCDFANSVLYMAQKKDNSMLVLRTSQIEFFERLKEMLKQVQHDKNFQGVHDKVAQLQQAILNKIDIDLQEATLAIKSKSKVNNTTVNQALAIIKSLQSQENISDHLFDILDEIKNSIRNHNSTLIKKVLELDLTKTEDGLFSNFEPEILSLQKYIHSKTYKSINAKIAIAMLGE